MRRSVRGLVRAAQQALAAPWLPEVAVLPPLSFASSAIGSSSAGPTSVLPGRRLVSSGSAARHPAHHAPADELPAGPPAEAASVPLEDTLEDVEAEAEGLEGLELLGPAPTGPGSEFIRHGPLGRLPLGTALQASTQFHGRQWQFETGKMARLADGACTLSVGQTTVLATAVCGSTSGFFSSRRDPLLLQLEVEYREKSFAAGRIPGGYNKREGGPLKEHEVLAGRRVDRALRPLFPRGLPSDLQISASVLSADGEHDLDVTAINAASAALLCSDIPWGGPVAAVRVVLGANGELAINPPPEQQELAVEGGGEGGAVLRLLVATTTDRVVMLEAEGAEVPEQEFARALRQGVEEARKLLPAQLELAAKAGRPKRSVALTGADLAAAQRVFELAGGRVEDILRNEALDKTSRARALQAAKQDILQLLRDSGSFRFEASRTPGSGCVAPSDLEHAFTALMLRTLRRLALEEGLRPDGRGLIDLRELHCEVDTVPVVHGSALFTRGETQSLCTVTVGNPGDEQRTESLLEREGSKRLAVHYAFPAFAINETSVGGQRREAGHSALAERALLAVLPPESAFPFPLRLNADTLASNGSSSLAAVCGGSLALADAGVPLNAMVAGVSVGLMTEHSWGGVAGMLEADDAAELSSRWPQLGQYELLVDLMGLEDAMGDMDFKIAGSRTGITACQLDVKLPGGVPEAVVEEALLRARQARLAVLDVMEAAERSPQSPQYGVVRVPASTLGRVIGAGGSNIRALCEATGARITVEDGGEVRIYAPSPAAFADAKERVLEAAGENIQAGQTYHVKVTRLADFGAFVEFGSGVRCLLHISELSPTKVRSVADAVQVGDEFEVLCMGRDNRGNILISRKALLAQQQQAEAAGPAAAAGSGSGQQE